MIEFKPTEKYADIFTERYECDDYACMAHPNGCFFCEHLTDVFWDYTCSQEHTRSCFRTPWIWTGIG